MGSLGVVVRGALLVAALVVSLGSAATPATRDQLLARAAFDLDCDRNKIVVVQIDDQTNGVRGCGKRATYVETCDGPKQNENTSCTWVLNSPPQDKRKPLPPPPRGDEGDDEEPQVPAR
jgi:hypothetical protein